MKKSKLIWGCLSVIAACLLAQNVSAQVVPGRVGVNTANPMATFDVMSTKANGSTAQGIIAPRLRGDSLTTATVASKYDATNTGAMVYVTDATATTTDSQMVNVTAPGYYYWDGAIWQKYATSATAWMTKGNAGTKSNFIPIAHVNTMQSPDILATNYIGTTDSTDLVFAVFTKDQNLMNSGEAEAMRITMIEDTVVNPTQTQSNPMVITQSDMIINNVQVGRGGGSQYGCTGVGRAVLYHNSGGTGNTAIGAAAMLNDVNGSNNVAVGEGALSGTSTSDSKGHVIPLDLGHGNVAVGPNALYVATQSMNDNVAIGRDVLLLEHKGSNGIFIGAGVTSASRDTTMGDGNIIIGGNAGWHVSVDSVTHAPMHGDVILGSLDLGVGNNTVLIGSGGFGGHDGTEYMRMIPGAVASPIDAPVVSVGIGGTPDGNDALEVNGSVIATGSVTFPVAWMTSDRRLKTNIKNLTAGTDVLMKLRPVIYDKKTSLSATNYPMKNEMGFIAQEIRKVLPNVVKEGKDKDKLLAVDYTELIPVLTKAFQEQEATIKTQQTQIDAQQKQIDELKQLVSQLAKK